MGADFGSELALARLEKQTDATLDYLVKYSQMQGFASESHSSFGTDVVEEIAKIAEKVSQCFPQAIYFSSRYVYPAENWFTRMLHTELTSTVQRRLHMLGAKTLILTVRLKI